MAGSVEFHWINPRHLGEPVEQAVPRQGMRPFVAEHLDGLRFTKIAIEQDQESLFSPKSLAQNGFGVPESSNDHGKGWRASIPKACQNCPKIVPFRAVHGGDAWCVSGQGCAPPSDTPRRLLFPNSLMSTGTETGGAGCPVAQASAGLPILQWPR